MVRCLSSTVVLVVVEKEVIVVNMYTTAGIQRLKHYHRRADLRARRLGKQRASMDPADWLHASLDYDMCAYCPVQAVK